NEPAAEIEAVAHRAEDVAARVAGVAVAEPPDEIRAAVPISAAGLVGLELSWVEEQRAPCGQRSLGVVRESKRVRLIRLRGRGQSAQIVEHGIRILARDLGEVRIRERRVKQSPISRTTVVKRTPEI